MEYSNEVKEILENLKQKSNKLYLEIKKNKITQEEIEKNLFLIEKYLVDLEDVNIEYRTDIIINDGLLYESVIRTNDDLEIVETIKSNYIFPLVSKDKYSLKITKDFKKTESRKELSLIFKDIFTNNFKENGLWIYGDFGVGKTFASICLLNKFAEKNKKVGFLLFPELVIRVNSTITNNDSNEKMFNLLERIKNLDVVVFDDIGSEKSSSWFRDNFLFPLLNYRFENNKLTIFTSNLKLEDYYNVLKQYKSNLTVDNKIEKISANRIIERIENNIHELELKGSNYRNK